MRGPLTSRIRALCEAVVAHGDDGLAARVTPIVGELDGPLRVAIAGRVNAGKSTLVNALLRRRVAPTRTTECTQFATWYHYGTPERVVVQLRDGTARAIRLGDDGRLPDTVGVAPGAVDRLDVYLADAVLRDLTIIDTPGLASLNEANSDRTEDLLNRSTDASASAEAVLFVFSVSLKADERDILRDFHASSASVGSHSPVNALGILSKIDTLVDPDEDPWPVADRLAADFAGRLSHEVAGIIPVLGLVAETVDGGAFTEADATSLEKLATMDRRERRRLLRTVDAFVEDDAPVSDTERRRLRDRLDLHGVANALDLIDSGTTGAARIGAELSTRSRINEVRAALTSTFARRSDALKASWALGRLARLAHDPSLEQTVRFWLADRVEEARLESAMHRVAVIEALNDLATGKANLPAALASALTDLADGISPAERVGLAPSAAAAEIAGQARALGAEFTTYAFDAFPSDAHVARVGARACHLIAENPGATTAATA